LNEVEDSLDGIVSLWSENVWLSSKGGGIGTYWGNLRSMGEAIGLNRGSTSGIMPFIKVMESITQAIGQGSLRRGASAVYLPIWHPEIEEFMDMRRPTGGDPSRKCIHLHHAVVISDAFMEAVESGKEWDLISPATGQVMKTVSARNLWIRLLTNRVDTGEPYLLFIDTINRALPAHHAQLNLKVKTSNLCNEITLPTGRDHLGHTRTAVCCLSAVNLTFYQEWSNHPHFLEDCLRFLDNVLESFIQEAPESFRHAVYAAQRERSIGLGVMGFHDFLQKAGLSFESSEAKIWNQTIFKHMRQEADRVSQKLAHERGPCLDAKECGIMERFSYKMCVPPTASTSIICGGTSPGIEPYYSNGYLHKTLSGSFEVKNPNLKALLASKNQDIPQIWSQIFQNNGSVRHLACLSPEEKAIFKTAIEINQNSLIDLAADRAPWICQGQSLNLFISSTIHKKDLHELHFSLWKKGIKGAYYVRSVATQRAENEKTAEDFLSSLPDGGQSKQTSWGASSQIEKKMQHKENKTEITSSLETINPVPSLDERKSLTECTKPCKTESFMPLVTDSLVDQSLGFSSENQHETEIYGSKTLDRRSSINQEINAGIHKDPRLDASILNSHHPLNLSSSMASEALSCNIQATDSISILSVSARINPEPKGMHESCLSDVLSLSSHGENLLYHNHSYLLEDSQRPNPAFLLNASSAVSSLSSHASNMVTPSPLPFEYSCTFCSS